MLCSLFCGIITFKVGYLLLSYVMSKTKMDRSVQIKKQEVKNL